MSTMLAILIKASLFERIKIKTITNTNDRIIPIFLSLYTQKKKIKTQITIRIEKNIFINTY